MANHSVFHIPNSDPCPTKFNLAGYVLGQAGVTPEKTALEVVGEGNTEVWTYAALARAVFGTAAGLKAMGLPSGARILLRVGNSVEFPLLFLGAIAAGYVPVPTSSQLTKAEILGIIRDLNPSLVCFGEGVDVVEPLPCLHILPDEIQSLKGHQPVACEMGDPNRLAYIIYTSGTSGTPRAVQHAHRAVWARRMMWDGWYGLKASDRVMHAGAFNWTYTLGTGLMDPWAMGATAIVTDGKADRHSLPRLIREAKATIFAATPGVLRQMLGTDEDLNFPALRHALSAGEKLPEEIKSTWASRTGTEVYEAMGMSEVSTFLSSSPSHRPDKGAVGLPQIGRRIAVLNEKNYQPVPYDTPGILAVSKDDPGLMLGYLNAAKETADKFTGEWFLTGDTVSMAKNGSVTYLGRDDDMMNAGGYRVSPLEVEAVLNTHPEIHESAATAIEIKPNTFVIAAFYLADAKVNQKELTDFCATSLAAYKCPRLFVHLSELPKGANGKLRRSLLKNRGKDDQA